MALLLLFGALALWLGWRQGSALPEPGAPMTTVSSSAGPASAKPAQLRSGTGVPAPNSPITEPAKFPALAELEADYCRKGRSLWELGQQWSASLAASDPHAVRQLSGPLVAHREASERMLRAALTPLLDRLYRQGSERSVALAEFLSQRVQPDAELEQRLLVRGSQTRDPLVLLLASNRPCASNATCVRPNPRRWSELEPDNAAAWLASELRGDALLQRLVTASRFSTHWDGVRQLLNQAQPPSTASAAPLHLEIFLIGVEAAWSWPSFSALSQHCKTVVPRSVEAQRCALVLEQLWQATANDQLASLMITGTARYLPDGAGSAPPWTARRAWAQTLMRLESDLGTSLDLHPVMAGCEATTPGHDLLAAVRREGRMSMLQRLLIERQSAAAALRP